jgi:DNA-binding beta-propeller fold protein YncE
MKGTRLLSIVSLLVTLSHSHLQAQDHQLEKLWVTDSVLKVPESVLYSANDNLLYVANIEGTDPWTKDGQGSVWKLATDGKIIKADWITGLNSPKGMGIYNGKLFVADMVEVVVIDIKKGTIIEKIPVEGAQGLNDISIGAGGAVYVTDSKNKKLYKIENKTVTTVLENLKGPNGVLFDNTGLYIVDAGGLYRVEADKNLTRIADGMEGGTDGIEHVGNGDHIVSCWGGVVYYVKADGTKQTLIDTREQKINSADIGYDPKNRIVYVPTFWRNSVYAYKLK